MIEIMLLAIIIIGATRKGKRRRRYSPGFAAISFTTAISLGTLGSDTVVTQAMFSNAFEENFYAMSCKAQWGYRNGTITEGPVEVGYAHSDYTVGEVAEKLSADESNVRGDKIANEQSRRDVRRAGMFAGAVTDDVLNDGRGIKTALRFRIGNNFNLNVYARNRSGAVLTTGGLIIITGTLYGRYT